MFPVNNIVNFLILKWQSNIFNNFKCNSKIFNKIFKYPIHWEVIFYHPTKRNCRHLLLCISRPGKNGQGYDLQDKRTWANTITTAFQRYQSINKNNPAREQKCWLTLWQINLSHVKNHRKNAWFHFQLSPRVLERIFFKYWETLIQTSWIYSIFGMAIFFTLKD